MDYSRYLEIIKTLNETYGTVVEVEHENIHEFYEGPNPLFKLVLDATTDPEASPMLIVSFHLETPTTAAIQWFLRLRQLEQVYLTGCYIKDAQGTTYVGEDAEIYRMYALEQQVIQNWLKSDREDEELLQAAQNPPPEPPPIPTRTFATESAAMAEFNRVPRKKGDTFH